MSRLQDMHAAEAQVGATQINESEAKVWRQPTLTTWKVGEETLSSTGSKTGVGADCGG